MPDVAEPRVAQHVVTSQNREEFMNKRLDIVKPPEKVIAPDTKDAKLEIPVLGEKNAEEPKKEEEVKAEEKKKDHPISERFSEMAEKRRAAEAREKAALERAEKAEREAAELKAKTLPPQEPDKLGPAPKREDFKTEDEYIDAKVDHGVKKAAIQKAVADEKARVEAEANRILKDWQERLAVARKEIPDFDEKIEGAQDVVFSNQVRDAIFESPMGPRILHYFADHKDEALKLKDMTALSAIYYIGELGGRLKADLTPQKKEATSPSKAEVVVSKAPAPISPLKGSSAPEDLVGSDGKFKGSFQQFKQLRKEGKLK